MADTVPTRSAEWFDKHLFTYFVRYYSEVFEAEFLTSPAKNQYVFDLPGSCRRIILTCNADATIDIIERYYKNDSLLEKMSNAADAAAQTLDKEKYKTFFETEAGIGHPYYQTTKHFDGDYYKWREKKPKSESIWKED